jgi:hypothetical protein
MPLLPGGRIPVVTSVVDGVPAYADEAAAAARIALMPKARLARRDVAGGAEWLNMWSPVARVDQTRQR